MLKSRLKENCQVNCWQCQATIIVKYNYPRKDWTLINNWGYWTEKESDRKKYVCNSCLKKLYYENKRTYWQTVTSEAKRMRMRNHIYTLTKTSKW